MALGKVLGVYRLTQDVELRYLSSGSAVAKLKLVNSSKYKSASGEQKEESCFIDGTIFGRMAEIANQYLVKGSKIFVNAELKQETWEKDGQKQSRHSLKIDSFEMIDSKPIKNMQEPPQGGGEYIDSRGLRQNTIPSFDVDDISDSIPF